MTYLKVNMHGAGKLRGRQGHTLIITSHDLRINKTQAVIKKEILIAKFVIISG